MGRGVIDVPRLVVPGEQSEADRAAILAGLADFNREHAEAGVAGPLAVLLKDAGGVTVGRLWGSTYFDWLRIELLFVPKDNRGASLGTALMGRAEAVAAARGCIGASLHTYSFQARGFYEKLGYNLVGTIGDYPPGGACYVLSKRFGTE